MDGHREKRPQGQPALSGRRVSSRQLAEGAQMADKHRAMVTGGGEGDAGQSHSEA